MALDRAALDRSKPIRSQAAGLIEDAILTGMIRPGEEVPQLKLARQLGLSQPSVREVLQELEHRGLVMKKGRARTVTDFSEMELSDMFQVRLLIEPHACRLAAYHWTEKLAADLERVLEAMRASAERQDYREHIRMDLEFHRTIWRGQPNAQLERTLNVLCTPIFAYELVRRSASSLLDFNWNLRHTRTILTVLSTRDGERAERVVRRIMEKFRRRDLSDYRRIARMTQESEVAPQREGALALGAPLS